MPMTDGRGEPVGERARSPSGCWPPPPPAASTGLWSAAPRASCSYRGARRDRAARRGRAGLARTAAQGRGRRLRPRRGLLRSGRPRDTGRGGRAHAGGRALTIPEIAGQLADCGARMLLTSPPLAAAALAAADRSWVRQVISFGEAPGATQFSALLGMGALRPAPVRGPRPGPAAVRAAARRLARPGRRSAIRTWPTSSRRLGVEAGISEQGRGAGRAAGRGRPGLHRPDRSRAAARRDGGGGRAEELAAAADLHQGTAMIVPGSVAIGAHERLRVFAVAS